MSAVASEVPVVDTREFFAELNKGLRHIETTRAGTRVELYLQVPSVDDKARAGDLFDALDAEVLELDDMRSRLVRLACLACVAGVNRENLTAFLRAFPTVPKVVVECLRLLDVDEDAMRRIGIDPKSETAAAE